MLFRCTGGRLIPKPDDLDESELEIQQCLPPDAEQPAEAILLTWARALLFLDARLMELHDDAVPAIVPEVVFWQRYFGQIYRAIQYAMTRASNQQKRGARKVAGAVDHAAIAAAVRRAVMFEEDPQALNNLLIRVMKQVGPEALTRAANAIQDPESAFTVLHWSAVAGNGLKCEILVRYGASVMSRTVDGMTPLFVAAAAGQVQTVELLLKVKADANAMAEGEVSAVQVSHTQPHHTTPRHNHAAAVDAHFSRCAQKSAGN